MHPLGQGVKELEMGGLAGGKQVFQIVLKSNPYQLDHIGMEFSFSWERALS